MEEKYQSIIEYAREHSISDMTVRRRIKTGKLQAVLREGKYFIPLGSSSLKASQAQKNSITRDAPRVQETETPQRAYTPSPERPYKKPSSPVNDESLKRLESFLSSSNRSHPSSESKKIIELCEKVLVKVKNSEFFLEEKLNRRLESFETELSMLRSRFEAKNSRVGHLERKVEDMKMLLDLMEEETLN